MLTHGIDTCLDFMSGTSQASPHVSALAGLIWSVNPNLTNVQVTNIITSTAVDLGAPGKDDYLWMGENRRLCRPPEGAAVSNSDADCYRDSYCYKYAATNSDIHKHAHAYINARSNSNANSHTVTNSYAYIVPDPNSHSHSCSRRSDHSAGPKRNYSGYGPRWTGKRNHTQRCRR